MTKDELVQKIIKFLEVGYDKFLTKEGAYFNPLSSEEFVKKVPELKKAQFKFSKTETSDDHGTHVSLNVHGPNGIKLSLGSVLLEGTKVVPQKPLATKEEFIDFFDEHLPDMIR